MIRVKRLRRIAWNSLTAISLLLGAATIWLWVRSYGRIDRFDYVCAPACYTVNSANGHFDIEADSNAGYAISEQGFIWTPWSGPQGAADEAMVIRTMDYQFPRRTRFFGFTWGPPRVAVFCHRGVLAAAVGDLHAPCLAVCELWRAHDSPPAAQGIVPRMRI